MSMSADQLVMPLLELIAASEQGYALFDEHDVLRFANAAFRQRYGLQSDELPSWEQLMRLGRARGCGTVIESDDFESWLRSAKSRRGKMPFRTLEADMTDGSWVLVTETTMSSGWMWCCVTDVTNFRIDTRELRQERDRAMRFAWTDALTGISNRRYLQECLSSMLAVRGRSGMVVVAFDIDHFKRLNDTYGHDAGDQVLRHFAQLLQGHVRRDDVAGRHGGEEFLLILGGATLTDAKALTGRLLEAVRTATPVPALAGLRYTVSAGLAEAVAIDDVERLLKRADMALYEAKRNGRDRYAERVWDEASER